jgi:tellurite resistance protein TerC
MTFEIYAGFVVFILFMLFLDLGVVSRGARVVRVRDAMLFSGFCVLLAVGFGILVYFAYRDHWFGIGLTVGTALSGGEAARQFFAGWLIEQSLSLDNIFVFAVVFNFFRVPPKYQHRALFWGVIGALVLRGVMIWAGTELLTRFEWIIYVFGLLLIVTAVRLLTAGDSHMDPGRNWLVRLVRRFYPVTQDFDGEKWFTKVDGRTAVTPLFLTILVLETTDVIFAVDSIPAVFAVTSDPFLVFTSNVFAILNLRSLYFALAGLLLRFRFLKVSLAVILMYVGVKMIAAHYVQEHLGITKETLTLVTLAVIGLSLLAGVLASWLLPPRIDPHNPVIAVNGEASDK